MKFSLFQDLRELDLLEFSEFPFIKKLAKINKNFDEELELKDLLKDLLSWFSLIKIIRIT